MFTNPHLTAFWNRMRKFIGNPLDASVHCENQGHRAGPRAATPPPAQAVSAQQLLAAGVPLLNVKRLDDYASLGVLDEFMQDYVEAIARLVEQLGASMVREDRKTGVAAMHSLLGISGDAGAQALYELLRHFYVPIVEHGRWPQESGWIEQVKALTAQSAQAMRDYAAQRAATGKATVRG